MRRRRIAKREMTPDVKYNSELVARLINTIMRNGKKSVAQKIVYSAFDVIKEKKKDMEPLEVFLQAVENIIVHLNGYTCAVAFADTKAACKCYFII